MNQGRAWGTVAILAAVALAGCSAQVEEPIQGAEAEPEHPLRNSSFSWDPHFPEAGQLVFFEPHVRSSAPGDEIQGFIWDFGDVQYTDSHPTYSFDTAGSHVVELRIDTAKGGTWRIQQTVDVVAAPDAQPQGQTSAGTAAPAPEADGPSPTILVTQQNETASFAFQWPRTPDTIHWDFGDGTTSAEAAPTHTYLAKGDYDVTLRLAEGAVIGEATTSVTVDAIPFQPHVIIGIPDSGINPYHEIYRRPQLTEHPCTYIRDFPCSLPALELTFDARTWQEAFAADRAKWESIRPGQWFWIPQTVFVAVGSDTCGGICILDDTDMHGTGTTSSALMENPDALIAFKEGGSTIQPIIDSGVPVDVYSVSWGNVAPIPGHPAILCANFETAPIFVTAAGNDPRSTLIDCRKGHPSLLTVGGAYADGTEEALAAKQPEFVSYYCRPTAQTESLAGMRTSYCGTSFSAPTVAGAISKAILAVRQQSGYTGTLVDGMVDPVAGITIQDLRDAVEKTATYDPEGAYPNTSLTGIPVVEPWLQWGWGFYDGLVAEATILELTGTPQPAKDPDAVTYLETMQTVKQTLYG